METKTYLVILTLGIASTRSTGLASTTHTAHHSAKIGHATRPTHAAELGEVNVAEAALLTTTHATEVVRVVVLTGLILLVLIDPL